MWEGVSFYISLRMALRVKESSWAEMPFFDVLRDNSLLIQKKKNYKRTTNSYHRYHVYRNEIKDLSIAYPNQVFVSDITYIRVLGSFMYLSLVTDSYSRKIVGHCLRESLPANGALSAVKMAMRGVKEPCNLTDLSDRGVH